MHLLTTDVSRDDQGLDVLFLGAHSDDIEIGCGGALLKLLRDRRVARVTWAVLGAVGVREAEARAGAEAFLGELGHREIWIEDFRDGFFPSESGRLKEWFESAKSRIQPDVIFTHHRDDRHQDHRLVSELTWNTFRDHLILEYEVPKYDGELGQPNLFIALDRATVDRKIDLLQQSFPSQRERPWFDRETFSGLMRLRGVEAGGGVRYAEAFHLRKAQLR